MYYRPRADPSKMVKAYRRPTVGKDENPMSEIRPPWVLRETVDYLIDRYVFYPLPTGICFMSPLRRGGGHIVFGVDPVGVVGGVGVGVAFCLLDIS